MHWQRLDRSETSAVIDSVASAGNPGLLSAGTSEAKRARLPYYNSYALYQITNYASLPSFTFEYLGDGHFYQYLDGTEEPIYTVNDKSALRLNESNVVDYLEFFFRYTSAEEGDIYLIKDPYNMPFADSLDELSHDAMIDNHRDAEIVYEAEKALYTVKATLFYDGVLNFATIEVTEKGRVKIIGQDMIVSKIGHNEAENYA